jgi:hypothetical protein
MVHVMGRCLPLPGKFWAGGQLGIGWTDEEDEASEEPLNVEGIWEIAACWLQPAFLDEVPVAILAADIIVADMVATNDTAADLVATGIFAKGASEDMGALGECTGTLRAKSGHLFKNDRTASRFSSLFADLGDYDDLTTRGGAQLDKLGHWPYSTTPVLDTG